MNQNSTFTVNYRQSKKGISSPLSLKFDWIGLQFQFRYATMFNFNIISTSENRAIELWIDAICH